MPLRFSLMPILCVEFDLIETGANEVPRFRKSLFGFLPEHDQVPDDFQNFVLAGRHGLANLAPRPDASVDPDGW